MENKKNMIGFELLDTLKNSGKIEKDGTGVKLVFEKEIEVSDSEKSREFAFSVPTVENIEKAIESTENIKNEEMRQLNQSYFFISSQFKPQFHPNDIARRLSVDELKTFNKVLEPFLS
jgi:hypothetical protein